MLQGVSQIQTKPTGPLTRFHHTPPGFQDKDGRMFAEGRVSPFPDPTLEKRGFLAGAGECGEPQKATNIVHQGLGGGGWNLKMTSSEISIECSLFIKNLYIHIYTGDEAGRGRQSFTRQQASATRPRGPSCPEDVAREDVMETPQSHFVQVRTVKALVRF